MAHPRSFRSYPKWQLLAPLRAHLPGTQTTLLLENHPEIEGTSCVWLSLGHWGSSEEIMLLALNSLSSIGDTYIDVNDCDDTGFVKV